MGTIANLIALVILLTQLALITGIVHHQDNVYVILDFLEILVIFHVYLRHYHVIQEVFAIMALVIQLYFYFFNLRRMQLWVFWKLL